MSSRHVSKDIPPELTAWFYKIEEEQQQRLDNAKAEGRAEGRAEGKAEARRQTLRIVARNLLKLGYTLSAARQVIPNIEEVLDSTELAQFGPEVRGVGSDGKKSSGAVGSLNL